MIFNETYNLNYVKTVMEFVQLCEEHTSKKITRIGLDEGYNRFAVIFSDKETKEITLPPVVPVPVATSIPVKKTTTRTKHGDLKIPFRMKDNKTEYQRAWALCKYYGFVTYPEALKLQEEKAHKKKQKLIVSEPEPSTEIPTIIVPGTIVKYVRGRGKYLRCKGMVKRTNMASGDILVQFDKGLEWITAQHCDIVRDVLPVRKVQG